MEHAATLIGYRDPLARAYLRGLLRHSDNMSCAAEADSFAGMLDALRGDKRITFALIEVDLLNPAEGPGLRYLVERFPETRFAALVSSLSQQLVDRLVGDGAAGCIPKSLPADALVDAFRTVLHGPPYVPSGYVPSAAPAPVDAPRHDEVPELTDRQIDVLRLLALGHSNREISEILSIAEGTVKVHVNAAFRALGVHNRVRAAAAVRERLSGERHDGNVRASSDRR